MKLSKVLADKRNADFTTTTTDTTLRDAAKEMIAHKTTVMLVTDKNTPESLLYAGLISFTDLVMALGKDVDMDTAKVENYMTRRMIVANINDDVEYVMNVMLRHDIAHLPIINGKKVCTIISQSDILNSLNVEKEIQIQWLNDYVGVPAGDTHDVY